ncbi:MAG: branched-chain amino acid ABC transporter substrate-binding protein [Acidimicrobiia bacterium]
MRLRHLAVMVLALALVAAACGDGDTTTTTAGGSEDPLGVVEVQPGEAIQIRAHQAISGPAESLGIDQVRGVELAIADFGDIHGFPVDMGVAEDDLCSAEGGQAGAQAIVAQGNVVAVIGTTCSGAQRAAMPVYSAAGMVLFSGSNTAPDLTSDLQGTAGESFQPGYYRTAHNDLFQGAAVAKFVFDELGLTRAAAVHDGDPYTQGLANAFRSAFETLGGEVPVFTATSGTAGADQTALLTEIAGADVEVVFFPIFPGTGGPEIIQQKDGIAGLEDVVWFGADGLFVGDYISIPETEGMYFSGPDLDFGGNVSATGKNYAEMRAAYEAANGVVPPAPFHAHTYDATVLVLTAIREVGVVGDDGVLRIGRQALRDYLETVADFDGLIGKITCDEFGDCGSQRVQIAYHTDSSVTDISLTPVSASYTRADLIGIITGG